MNDLFNIINHGGLELLVYRPWWESGVVHGMTTGALSFRGDSTASDCAFLCGALGVRDVVVPRQCHGKGVLDLRSPALLRDLVREQPGALCRFEEGDALLAPLTQEPEDAKLALGVMSADCVPILALSENGWALIHAGWRGLSNGVISAALGALGGVQEAAVFASAGGESYEVDRGVIDAIGPSAVFKASPRGQGKFLLDTGATAVRQLLAINGSISVASAGICTIQDGRFHSFRRDGERAGRGVTFVIPAG